MTDLVFAVAMLLLGRDGAVVPQRPAPMTVQPGTVEDIPDPQAHVLHETTWGA